MERRYIHNPSVPASNSHPASSSSSPTGTIHRKYLKGGDDILELILSSPVSIINDRKYLKCGADILTLLYGVLILILLSTFFINSIHLYMHQIHIQHHHIQMYHQVKQQYQQIHQNINEDSSGIFLYIYFYSNSEIQINLVYKIQNI